MPGTVIVVEDDTVNLALGVRIFMHAGVQFRAAGDGVAPLSLLAGWSPAAVMLDMSLLLMDGWEMARRLRADPLLRDLRVLGVSAHAMTGDRERTLALADADASLAASTQRYRFMADAMPQIISTGLPDGKIDYYNDHWYEYTGMTLVDTKATG